MSDHYGEQREEWIRELAEERKRMKREWLKQNKLIDEDAENQERERQKQST